jgi:hypothetical protein
MEGVMMSNTSKSALCLLISFALTAFALYLMAEPHTPIRSTQIEAHGTVSAAPWSGDVALRPERPAPAYLEHPQPIDELNVIRCLGSDVERPDDDFLGAQLRPGFRRPGRCPL